MGHLSFRVPDLTLARLDALAAERGVTRSKLVRQAVDALIQGEPLPPQEPLSEQEILAILSERARAGNVSALRTMLAREQGKDPRERTVELLRQMVEEHRQ